MVLLLAVLFGCNKNDAFNLSQLPSDDHIQPGTQSYTLQGRSSAGDSVISYNSRYKLLGHNLDPDFGETRAALCLNINMSTENVSFGSDAEFSYSELVFALDPFVYSGAVNSTLSIRVFPLDSALYTNRKYYTNSTTPYQLVSWPAVLTPTSILSAKPVLRVRLDSAFGAALMKNQTALSNNTSLQSLYKGFFIEALTHSGQPGIIYKIDLEDPQSGYFIRYQKTPQDTLSAFRFSFSGSKAVRYNQIRHAYLGGSPLLNQQIEGNYQSGTEKLFLKGLGHTCIKLNIPQFQPKPHPDSLYTVSRAELILYLDRFANTQSGYAPPGKLSLLALDSLGSESYTLDQLNALDAARYDGVYDDTYKCYRFNIVKHAQAILHSKIKNYGFVLQVADPAFGFSAIRDLEMGRVIFEGSAHTTLAPKFLLHYTALKKPQ